MDKQPSRRELVHEAAEELRTCLGLEANWDGYGAAPVKPEAAVKTLQMIARLTMDGAATPQITPVEDGGLITEWLVGGDHMMMEVGPNCSWSMYAMRDNGEVVLDYETADPVAGHEEVMTAQQFLAAISKNVRFRRPRPQPDRVE